MNWEIAFYKNPEYMFFDEATNALEIIIFFVGTIDMEDSGNR
ncbi:MAG TPA: hypothetical protein VL727_16060 [Puia sp.]|nr:hypothetical protein [Puia sp.]